MNKKVNQLQFLIAGILIFTLSLAFSRPAKASHIPSTIVAMPSGSNGNVYSITRVYAEPDDASRVVDVLSPGTHFNILGFNTSGSYIQIATEGQSLASGWVTSSEVSRHLTSSTSRSLTMAYLEPNSKSQIASVFTPGEEVKVLGHSADGSFLAIKNANSVKNPVYWVATNDMKLSDVIAITATLTKFYIKPDTSSRITNVLPPTQQVVLIGRYSTSGWYAVEDVRTNNFIGWALSNDLIGAIDRELLPVIPMR